MIREIIKTDKAPLPVGPYSQLVKYGPFLFISGQIAADVKTGKILDLDPAGQTEIILSIIKNILEEVGSGMDKILKSTIHLSDKKHFTAMNNVYSSYFKEGYPARLTVSGVQLYDGVDVEIDIIATTGEEVTQ